MATEICWNIKIVGLGLSLGSSVSDKRDQVTQITDELKSNASYGAHCHEWWGVEQVIVRYLSIFDFFALCCGFCSRCATAWRHYHVWCDAATVLVTVTSHVALHPPQVALAQMIDVNRVGRFPSDLYSRYGFLADELPADFYKVSYEMEAAVKRKTLLKSGKKPSVSEF